MDASRPVEGEVAQREQRPQRGAELVGGRLAHGGEAPVVHQLLAAERAEVRLGVADVDDEEHAADYARDAVPAVLYAIPASHPCAAVEAALRVKGVPFERVDYLPLLSRLPQRRRFGRATVPGVVFADGERV